MVTGITAREQKVFRYHHHTPPRIAIARPLLSRVLSSSSSHRAVAHPTQARGSSGSSVTGIVPTNTYPCIPSASALHTPIYIIIGANGDSLYTRLTQLIGAPHLAGADYVQNHHRVARRAEIEAAIAAWTAGRSAVEVVRLTDGAGVSVWRVVSMKEVVEGGQVTARDAALDFWVLRAGAQDDGWYVKIPGTFPMLEGCDSKPRWAGSHLGTHTEEVLVGDLGLWTWGRGDGAA